MEHRGLSASRLLRQPHGFEGRFPAGEARESVNLAVAYHGNPARGRLHRDATPLTAREGSTEDQHRGAAEITELVDLDPEISPGRLHVGQESPEAMPAAIDVALGSSDNARAHLDVGMGDLDCGVDGLPAVGIEQPAHDWSCPGFDDTWTLPVVSRRK
jgi:hypothetical protein